MIVLNPLNFHEFSCYNFAENSQKIHGKLLENSRKIPEILTGTMSNPSYRKSVGPAEFRHLPEAAAASQEKVSGPTSPLVNSGNLDIYTVDRVLKEGTFGVKGIEMYN